MSREFRFQSYMQQKTDLSKYDNSWYNPGKKSTIALWYIINWIFFKSSIPYPSAVKVFILRFFGGKIGRNIIIKPNVSIKYPWNLAIGDNVWLGENVWIDNLSFVKIGNNVCISQGVYLLCGNHNYKRDTFDLFVKEIVLEDGCWLGAQSIVCPGVTVENHAILTVGSIASVDLDSFGIYKGNPAVKVGERRFVE